MGKNNPLRSMTPKNKNQKLYKAKKQWITACATFMLAFGPTGVVNASVQADTTTPATTQAGGIVAESAQPQNSGDETALDTAETKINIVANTTDTSRTSEQKTTTAQATENSSSASSGVNKTNSEEENKNAFLTFNVNTADTPANEAIQENKIVATTATTTTNGGYDY